MNYSNCQNKREKYETLEVLFYLPNESYKIMNDIWGKNPSICMENIAQSI